MNNNTIPYSPTHDIPYYYQQDFALENNPHEYFSDSTIITTNTQNMTIDHHHHHHHQFSSRISENDDIHELTSPKTTTMKPIRRRSRSSKKTPTTLVNASITNFRALVQQHTGCHTCPTFKNNQKGPINLSFGPQNDQSELLGSNSIGEGSMNYGYYYNNNHEDQDEKYSKDNLQQEKQESGYNSVNYENSKLSVDDYGW